MTNKVAQKYDRTREGKKLRRSLVPLKRLSKAARYKRVSNLAVEAIMLATAIGYAIFFAVKGDPNNRLMSCVGLGAAAIAPIVIELIGGRRFTFWQHIIYDAYAIFSMYLGSVLYLHQSFAPFDEISHVIFGYISCLAVFYGLMYTRAVDKNKVISSCVIIFFVSMGAAAIWEIMEFSVDIFGGEHSLGFPEQGVIEYIESSGLAGIDANILALRYTSVLDTVTDMALHVVGSMVFVVQFLIYRAGCRNVLLGSLTREVETNAMNTAEELEPPEQELPPPNVAL